MKSVAYVVEYKTQPTGDEVARLKKLIVDELSSDIEVRPTDFEQVYVELLPD